MVSFSFTGVFPDEQPNSDNKLAIKTIVFNIFLLLSSVFLLNA